MAGKVKQFLHHVVPGVVKPIRVLWNEMIGFVFLIFGIWPIKDAWRAYRDEKTFMLFLYGSFSAVMLYFGVTSFLRARKINRT